MNNDYNRLRSWTQQRHVTVPHFFFQTYKELGILDDEAVLIMHLLSFFEESIDFPTPEDLAKRTSFTANDITIRIQRLLQKGFLEITQGVDNNGMIFEKYSLYPLWERIMQLLDQKAMAKSEMSAKNDEGEIFMMFEQEFGRLLSPMEIETISMWFDKDGHTPAIIKAALKEAVVAGKISLRYIDRILFEWKKKNITSVKQIEQHAEQFRSRSVQVVQPAHEQPVKSGMFYNWLDERE
ncbi:DnaD domain-containing protein [Lysinibacillus sp. KU-BSD001]|uniref:DnaD domain-containing protein n=1 Tax=Lysinibacillus sp. KU-BSD001 TaxID=3141328 RepID=UPI0036E9C96B